MSEQFVQCAILRNNTIDKRVISHECATCLKNAKFGNLMIIDHIWCKVPNSTFVYRAFAMGYQSRVLKNRHECGHIVFAACVKRWSAYPEVIIAKFADETMKHPINICANDLVIKLLKSLYSSVFAEWVSSFTDDWLAPIEM